MKIGIFGGTFNPIHIGHLIIAEHACEELELNKLLIIPAAIPPHKRGEIIIEGGHRLEMVKLAAKESPRFEVSDIELKKRGVSYSVETLRIIQARVKVLSEYYFIVGSDMVSDLNTWKEIDKLVDMCTFVVAVRPGFKKENWKKIGLNLPPDIREKVLRHTLENPMVEVSSTDIRRRIREGKSIRYMVPKTVEELRQLSGKDIVHVHVNDAPAGIAVDEQIDSRRKLPVTTGVIDLKGFINALVKIGYDGPVECEPFDQELRAMQDTAALRKTIDSLNRLWGFLFVTSVHGTCRHGN